MKNADLEAAVDKSSALKAWVRALEVTAPIERNPSNILPTVVDALADQFDNALALADAISG